MRISARCDYACKALLELALHWPSKEPLHIQVISKKQEIPMRYLVQILIQLKRMGLVDSVRGKEGGYTLTELPNKISFGKVMRQIQGPLLPVAECSKKNGSVFTAIWQEVEASMAKVLDKVTFEDVCNKVRGMSKTIIYQI
ncbi:RrF2 family transcriptional regulator [Candidatus Omnitrophota bacterium]